jgi:hypothetical protein
MPRPKKKQRMIAGNDDDASADDFLSVDVLVNILGFLSAKYIMRKRGVSNKWKEAVKMTLVPLTDFRVDSVEKYNAINVMTEAMPNLQQIRISYLGSDDNGRHKYSDGEDPVEERAIETANWPTHDIEIISNFSKLRELYIGAPLNGRYPFIFNSFPLLEKLTIQYSDYIKWDLDMLAGMPLLKELDCRSNYCLNGNINSLRVLKDTLEKVTIIDCEAEGNFMELSDFPHLKVLDLGDTAVTGDIRDVSENDFISLECLHLPGGVYGGHGYELHRISDGPNVVRAVYLLKKQRPSLKMDTRWRWFVVLSEDSPDWYESVEDDTPPFYICFVQAGSRLGYRWETSEDTPCEVNWLDPEPKRGIIGNHDYVMDCIRIGRETGLYRGYYVPPTEEQYQRNRLLRNMRWV